MDDDCGYANAYDDKPSFFSATLLRFFRNGIVKKQETGAFGVDQRTIGDRPTNDTPLYITI